MSSYVDYEIHKMMFKETLYILNTISDDLEYINNYQLIKVCPVKGNSDYDKYDFIFVKYIYNDGYNVCKGTRFIQELNDLEFD